MAFLKKIIKKLKNKSIESDAAGSPPRDRTFTRARCSDDDISDVESEFSEKKEKKRHSSSQENGCRQPSTNIDVKYNLVNCSGPHIGNVYTVYASNGNPEQSSQSKKNETPPEPSETLKPSLKILEAFKITSAVKESDILEIKNHIGEGWRQMGSDLGYNKAQLSQFKESYHPIQQAIYKLLLDWKRVNDRAATVGILCEILWDCNETDAAQILASLY